MITAHLRESKVFYLVCAENGLVKIGRAKDPLIRFRCLQLMSPVPLELLFVSRAGIAAVIERDLHHEFRHKRSHGEWFRLTEDDIASIRNRFKSAKIQKKPSHRRWYSTDSVKTRIKELRFAAGLTQEELGKMVGVGYMTIAAIENDRRLAPIRFLERLAKILGCETKDFEKTLLLD